MDKSFFTRFGFTEKMFGMAVHKTPDARLLIVKVYRELKADDQLVSPSIEILLLEFLHCAQHWKEEKRIPGWMKKVHELMNDRWSETLTLKDLSEAAGVHPVTVSHYFPHYFSCTLGAYMRKLKVEKALELLQSASRSLTDIAYECGFFDQSHFTRTFKNLTGFLPAAYQRTGK